MTRERNVGKKLKTSLLYVVSCAARVYGRCVERLWAEGGHKTLRTGPHFSQSSEPPRSVQTCEDDESDVWSNDSTRSITACFCLRGSGASNMMTALLTLDDEFLPRGRGRNPASDRHSTARSHFKYRFKVVSRSESNSISDFLST